MAKTQIKDEYSNKAYGTITESAANTLTFAEIPTNVDVMSKLAWVIHRIEWYLSVTQMTKLAAADDLIQVALTSSAQLSSLGLSSPAVVDLLEVALLFSTAVAYTEVPNPRIRDFSAMPGGGIIIAPRPLYLAIKGTSLATALTASARIHYTRRELQAEEYLELVDFYRIVG
jgi:hypothetical protein